MNRCLVTASACLALAVPAIVAAQVQRNFPANALRGEIVVTTPPEILLNGNATHLAPGARIRDQRQMVVMSGALVGQKLVVNYTLEQYGLVLNAWILRPEEIAKLWPRTPEEAAKWIFDPIAQTWTKP